MIILGIDPGIADTGYGVIDTANNTTRMITYGSIKTKAGMPLPQRLELLYQELQTIIATYTPEHIAVEELFFAKNTKTALTVSQARGVILLLAQQSHAIVREFTPLQIKQALTGYGRADKNQIQQMVKMLLKLKEVPKPDDAADALAIALCAAQTTHFA